MNNFYVLFLKLSLSAFLLVSCSSVKVNNETKVLLLVKSVESEKPQTKDYKNLKLKMSKETEKHFSQSILKGLNLSEISLVERELFIDLLDYYFHKNKKTILGVSFFAKKAHFPSARVPKNIEHYCGFTNDKTCNCYFWQDITSFSGECLIHTSNGSLDHSYVQAYFVKQNVENTKAALRLIKQIPNELYSDDNTEGYVSYIVKKTESKIGHDMGYVSENGCLYTIKYKDFISSLREAKTGQDYEINNYIGRVNFIELGEYWIDKNFTVMLMEDGKMWTLDQSDFEKGLNRVKTSSNKMKCKNVL